MLWWWARSLHGRRQHQLEALPRLIVLEVRGVHEARQETLQRALVETAVVPILASELPAEVVEHGLQIVVPQIAMDPHEASCVHRVHANTTPLRAVLDPDTEHAVSEAPAMFDEHVRWQNLMRARVEVCRIELPSGARGDPIASAGSLALERLRALAAQLRRSGAHLRACKPRLQGMDLRRLPPQQLLAARVFLLEVRAVPGEAEAVVRCQGGRGTHHHTLPFGTIRGFRPGGWRAARTFHNT
mmetsp:Transcript_69884/g.194347  ORF Transcript_69884/g.194347 Transcript_69884/m.194347 type:complete len:243 (+) Transcript_69884:384-1112(+)